MAVQDGPGRGDALMNGPVDAPGRGVRGIGSLHGRRVVGVQQDQFAGPNQGEVPPLRVTEELLPVRRDRCAEMVGYRLVEVEPGSQPKGSCQVDADLGLIEFLEA